MPYKDLNLNKAIITNVAKGTAIGALSLFFVYPFDLAKTRLAADLGSGSPS